MHAVFVIADDAHADHRDRQVHVIFDFDKRLPLGYAMGNLHTDGASVRGHGGVGMDTRASPSKHGRAGAIAHSGARGSTQIHVPMEANSASLD